MRNHAPARQSRRGSTPVRNRDPERSPERAGARLLQAVAHVAAHNSRVPRSPSGATGPESVTVAVPRAALFGCCPWRPWLTSFFPVAYAVDALVSFPPYRAGCILGSGALQL